MCLLLVIFENIADPDEMPPYAAFHLVLHCFPKNLFTGIQNEKVKVSFWSEVLKIDFSHDMTNWTLLGVSIRFQRFE